MAAETFTPIDLEALQRENPDSDTLKFLRSPEQQARDAERARGVYVGDTEDNWDYRLTKELDQDEPTISTAAAVAVYIERMRPLRQEFEQRALAQPSQLSMGQKAVKVTRDSGFGHGERINFSTRINGILASDAVVVRDTGGAASYNLALSFADQERPVRVSIGSEIAIGADEISELHAGSLGEKKRMWAESGQDIFAQRLANSAIMNKLGLIDGVTQFEAERDEVLERALTYTNPSEARIDNLNWSLGMLPDIHLLDPDAATARVEALARSEFMQTEESMFMDMLVSAVAEMRSPKRLFSLGAFAAAAARAHAQAEVYAIAAEQEYVPAISKEY